MKALTGNTDFRGEKICPTATLSITDPILNDLRLNSGSFDERSATMPWDDLCTVMRRQHIELAEK